MHCLQRKTEFSMRFIIITIVLSIASACQPSVNAKKEADSSDKKPIDSRRTVQKEPLELHQDTVSFNGQKYIRVLNDNNHFHCLLSQKGDTLIEPQDYYFDAEFLDINEDGYKDIRVSFFSNTPNQCDNFLFHPKDKNYQLLQNCDLAIQKIQGTDFYYSYSPVGCSDMDWESYLCKIEGNEQINYGYINGKGCDFDTKTEPQVIEVYKITNTKDSEPKLVQTLPYTKYIPEFEKKWDFIEYYWKKNYLNFYYGKTTAS